QGAAQGYDVLVVSGDRDTIQLVTDEVTLLYPSVQGVSQLKRYDPVAVQERYGVRPEQYPDIAALVGETSDNLPGVPKVGEKTAVKWLAQFGSLDELLERAGEIKGVVGGNLRDHIEDVRRNRRLNRLLNDVELPMGPDELVVAPIDAQAVRDIFARLEFRTLLPRVFEAVGAVDEPVHEAPSVQIPVAVESTAADIATWLQGRTTEVALTLITAGGAITRLGVADGTELRECAWDEQASVELRPWLESDATKAMHDAKPQVKALLAAGIRLGGLAYDTLLAGWLMRPSLPDKTLGHLVGRYLDEKLPEADPTQLVPETDGATPAQEAWFTLRTADAIRKAMPDSVATVLTEIELPTLLTLADMELAGVAVSHDVLSGFSGELLARTDALATDAFALVGREFNLGSPKQLQEVLFEDLQLPKTRKTKTGYSTDAAVLADLQETHPHR